MFQDSRKLEAIHDRHVALKILNSDFYNGGYQLFELEIMQRISDVGKTSSHPGKAHVTQLQDHFEVAGPSGQHVCLVFPLFGASIASQTTAGNIPRLPYHITQQVMKQLLEALDFLHDCGIIHTDISPSNILIELTDPERAAEAATRTGDSRSILKSTPLVTTEEKISIRLNDFGIACWVDRHLTDRIQPAFLRAPEINLEAPWDASVDIYNLGCLAFQLITGDLPFPGKSQGSWTAEDDRMATLIKLFGPAPEVVLQNAGRADEFSDNGVDLRQPHHETGIASFEALVGDRGAGPNARFDMPQEQVSVFCDLLQRMLATDPRMRESAKQLLQHEWFASV
ncbi:hypothetical protein MBLNU459_g8404t2 [Dothideomycetes sp. NU459]